MIALALAGAAIGASASAPAMEPPLELIYADRAPYYVTKADGSVGGLVAGPVSEALKRAKIPVRWLVRPGKRQIETIRKGGTRTCSPGWFKKPEREAFAKFSDPIYQDRPQILVVRAADQAKFAHPGLAALFGDAAFKFGAKLGYSYGAYVDGLIAETSPQILRTPQDSKGMIRMLLGRRFDYLMAAPEEFSSLAEGLGDKRGAIAEVQMKDIPPGNTRHLMCSKSVEDSVLERFNRALAVVIE